jgi:bifunctional DNA-binding transcriptional regulator/antitoxin component of YhaV-PrlF toxin-antitoxin module
MRRADAKTRTLKNAFSILVTRDGRITLPQTLREGNDWVEGTMLTLIDLGDDFMLLSNNPARVDEIANALAHQWQEAGLCLEGMLEALRELRAHKDKETPNP